MRLCAVEVVVPYTEDGKQDRQVLLKRCGLEVFVHTVCASEQLLEVIVANDKRDGQADCTPQRVATTDPVPELEHVLLGDTECGDSLGIGAQRDEVLRNMCLVLRSLEEPITRALRVRNRLLSREGLARDDEERSLGIGLAQGLGEVRAIDVGHEVRLQIALRVGLERLRDHDGPEIRATDTNVDDSVDGLTGITLPLSTANRFRELLDVREDLPDLVDTSLLDLEVVEVAERDVQYRAILGSVNVLSSEHLVAVGLDLGLADEVKERREDLLVDQVLGEVEEERHRRSIWGFVLAAKLGEAFWVLREEILEDELFALAVVELLELLPGRILW